MQRLDQINLGVFSTILYVKMEIVQYSNYRDDKNNYHNKTRKLVSILVLYQNKATQNKVLFVFEAHAAFTSVMFTKGTWIV